MGRINSLTSLRFFAALGVVLFHFPIRLPGALGSLYELLASHGYTGVTFFFILSGFLLASIYSEKPLDTPPSLKKFFLKRFIRIVPTYWFVLLLTLFFLRGQLGMAKAQGLLPERLTDVALHLTLLQSWVPASPFRLHWNEPSWSVSVEAFFYLLFPIMLILVWKAKDSISKPIIGLSITALLHGLIFYLRPDDSHATGIKFLLKLPLSSLTVFAFGMFGAMLVKELVKTQISQTAWKAAVFIGAGMILAFAMINKETNPFAQILLCTGMTTVVCGASQARGSLERFLSLPLFLILGEASYALYLIQRPTDEWLKYLWRNPSSMNVYHLVVIVVSVVASVAIWYGFERPVGRLLTKKFVQDS